MQGTTETLTLERTYARPPAQVFEAWTNVDVLRTWFGCAPDMLWTIHEWEPRVGGRLRVSLDFDGTPYEVRGEFVVVDAPHRLSYRWGADELIEVTIEAHEFGSRLRVEHTFPAGGDNRAIRTGGWTASLDHLGRV